MDITELPGNAVILLKVEDLHIFADYLASKFNPSIKQEPVKEQTGEIPISQAEASKEFGITRQTLAKWRRKKLINSYAINGRIYFKKSELIAAFQKTSK